MIVGHSTREPKWGAIRTRTYFAWRADNCTDGTRRQFEFLTETQEWSNGQWKTIARELECELL